jgi:Ala-tRNA(Pro) deacylase
MPATMIKSLLDREHVKYVTIRHSPAFTAQEVAESAHIPGRIMAKTVMVEIDGELAMTVLPSNHRVIMDDLCALTGTEEVRIAREDEFCHVFPDCEPGAMPPFGNLYDLSVFVSPDLAEESEIAFNAGTHTEVIRMMFHDFDVLVKPRVARFTD